MIGLMFATCCTAICWAMFGIQMFKFSILAARTPALVYSFAWAITSLGATIAMIAERVPS